MHVASLVRELAGGASVEDHVASVLARVGDDPLNAFVTLDPEGALERARLLDREGPRGRPLFGVTVSVKDNIAVQGLPLTCGSRALEGYLAPYDATVVERLREAGAVVVGKGNLDEFGCGSSGESSAHGPTRNPAAPGCVPGGSSSGAGAALAAGWVDVAIGSDTGGSARCPAAFCGVTALKPSYGTVSRYGLVDLAMSLESPAPMARGGDVEGLARLLHVLAGPDPRDAVTATASFQDGEGPVEPAETRGLRVAVAPEFLQGVYDEVVDAVLGAVGHLEGAGAERVEASVPSLPLALPAYYLLMSSELASGMQRFDGLRYGPRGEGGDLVEAVTNHRGLLGREVTRRILLGAFATSRTHRDRWYATAQAARARVAQDMAAVLRSADVLLAPTMPFPPFPLGERVEDPRAMYAADVLTVSANLAGVPAGSLPLPGTRAPVGLQVLARWGADDTVLSVMRRLEILLGGTP